MKISFNHSYLRSVIGVLPVQQIEVQEVLQQNGIEERQIRRLIKSIGFTKLRRAPRFMTGLDLVVMGSKKILEECSVSADEIDGLIFVTQSPDYTIPGNCYIWQKELGLKDDVVVMDCLQGCSGFVYALMYANFLIENANCKNILIGCADCITESEDLSQKGNVAIFGEGAGVALLSYDKNSQPSFFSYRSDGQYCDAIINYHSGVKNARLGIDTEQGEFLDGQILASYVLGDGGLTEIQGLLTYAHLGANDIEKFICHQANKSFLTTLSRMIGVDSKKIPFLAGETGNTSSASIPIALSEFSSIMENNGRPYMFSAFGTGLSSASVILSLERTKILNSLMVNNDGSINKC